MLFGFFARIRRAPLRGFAIQPLFAVLLLLTAPAAHAGWLGHLFGHRTTEAAAPQPAPTGTTDTATTPAQPAPNALATTSPPDASGNIPGNDADDPSALKSDQGNSDAGDTTDSDADTDTDSDDEQLPNVEESELGTVDTPDALIDLNALNASGDLWDRLRQGFQLDAGQDNDRIALQRNWYLKNPDYLQRMALRATRYLYYTTTEAEKRGLPTELALLPVIESAYDPFAYSHAQAAGMWQFIPGTGKLFGLKQDWWFDGRRDVIESTRAAYDFLSALYEKFGDWELALAAYNAGPGTVDRAIARNQAEGLPTDFWSLRLPAETRAYVPRFLAVVQIVKSPESFGVSLRPVVNQPFFRVISTAGQVDMTEAAKVVGVSLKELYQLNAGYNRWATDPDGPHRLLVPASLPQDFEAQVAALPVPERVTVETYRVKKGDTLYSVARRFKVSAAEIRKNNNLKSDRLAAGHTLTITRARISPEFIALNAEMKLDRSAEPVAGKVRRSYTVRRGDSLSSIARRHGVTTAQLARWNGLRTNSHLRAGQRLSLQVSKSSMRRVASSNSRQVRKIRYEVKKGDTLSSIGRRYKVSVSQIRRWNGKSGHLLPGQDIVLFVASRNL